MTTLELVTCPQYENFTISWRVKNPLPAYWRVRDFLFSFILYFYHFTIQLHSHSFQMP